MLSQTAPPGGRRAASRCAPPAAALAAAALLALAAALAAPVAPDASAATTVDRIVAQVNRNVITLSELQARINSLSPPQKAALSGAGDLARQVLDLMVDEELVNQAAQKIGLVVTDAEVSEAVTSIMNENKINQDQLRRALQASGTNLPAFRAQLRLEILKNKVLSYSIMNRIVVTESEVTDFLNGKTPEGTEPVFSSTGVSDFDGVRIIFLQSSPSRTASVMAKAAQIKAEIEAGLPFADAAKKYSQGPGADNGGDPGNLVVRDLQPELQALARKLVPGKVSEPLNGGDAVLLITVLQGSPARPSAPSEDSAQARRRRGSKKGEPEAQAFTAEQRAGARRQLEQIKMRRKYESWIQELRKNSVVRITL
ncbi:MAG: SurA N-terminal domain-containing protein [Deltaproteobacteria bacterium]|jgi:peptidyl-prolyl cis-trans isomerase SurA|nr:SurA N-terminal domain-containing protein [Deltaproteobacteria bacterium]